jgi:nudix-type nucleoside diphosphatase (YffH/AdpP family)
MTAPKKSRRVIISAQAEKFSGFLSIHEYKFRRSRQDGSMSRPITNLVMERGDAVAALVHDFEKDEIVLTRQFRLPVYLRTIDDSRGSKDDDADAGWLVETPAGTLEPGEKPEARMLLELREELGYAVSELERISTFFVSPGGTTERIHLYYAKVSAVQLVDPEATGLASEDEDIERLVVPAAQFVEDVGNGAYSDAKTIIAGLWLKARRQ